MVLNNTDVTATTSLSLLARLNNKLLSPLRRDSSSLPHIHTHLPNSSDKQRESNGGNGNGITMNGANGQGPQSTGRRVRFADSHGKQLTECRRYELNSPATQFIIASKQHNKHNHHSPKKHSHNSPRRHKDDVGPSSVTSSPPSLRLAMVGTAFPILRPRKKEKDGESDSISNNNPDVENLGAISPLTLSISPRSPLPSLSSRSPSPSPLARSPSFPSSFYSSHPNDSSSRSRRCTTRLPVLALVMLCGFLALCGLLGMVNKGNNSRLRFVMAPAAVNPNFPAAFSSDFATTTTTKLTTGTKHEDEKPSDKKTESSSESVNFVYVNVDSSSSLLASSPSLATREHDKKAENVKTVNDPNSQPKSNAKKKAKKKKKIQVQVQEGKEGDNNVIPEQDKYPPQPVTTTTKPKRGGAAKRAEDAHPQEQEQQQGPQEGKKKPKTKKKKKSDND